MQLEELRADIVDLKEMYREQVNLLVNKVRSVSFNAERGTPFLMNFYSYLNCPSMFWQIQVLGSSSTSIAS